MRKSWKHLPSDQRSMPTLSGMAFSQALAVFQNAAGQGKGALDAAMTLASGGTVEKKVYVPFELVTPENMDQYVSKN